MGALPLESYPFGSYTRFRRASIFRFARDRGGSARAELRMRHLSLKAPPSPYSTEILTGIKAKTRNLPKLAYPLVVIFCSVRLRSIFDHR